MATIPQVEASEAQVIEEAATKMARILEAHFDEMGWSEGERDRRVASASARIEAAAVLRAKSS